MRTRHLLAALVGLWAISFPSARAQSDIALASLTVPPDRLPGGCTLPASERIDRWAATNPWIGADLPVIATIRESMGPMPLVPDAPLTAREHTAYRLALANGVTEGYAALYREADGRGAEVLAVTFEQPENTQSAGRWRTRLTDADEFAIGRSKIVVRGKGACYDAVVQHVRAIAAP
jgi:hypothetical protein